MTHHRIMKTYRKRLLAFAAALVIAVSMTACSTTGGRDAAAAQQSSAGTTETTVNTASAISEDDVFSERDLSGEYDASDSISIQLDSDHTSCDSEQVEISGQTVTIREEGVYLVSGTLSDGQICVDAEDSDKIQIVLNGVQISNDSSAAIYVKSADKVFLTLANGTENSLAVTGAYEAIDDNNVDGVIFSKSDLTLNGTGSLTVSGGTGHGIVGKDDVVLTGGTYTITSAKKAISGKDSISIADGVYQITAGTDALHSSNTEDEEKGFIYISGGELNISAADDGIHASSSLTVAGGNINIEKCAEGLEGHTITIDDGQIQITSSDDGLNAAGDRNSSGGTENPFEADSQAGITIHGGTLHVNAGGDGIDSNGSLTVTGGVIEVEGPENNGNGAMDIGTEAVITGGTVIASGSSGMAVNFSEKSTQGSILQTVDAATGTITLTDESGNVILSMDTDKQFNSVLVSSPQIVKDSTYTLTTGGKETSIQMSSLVMGSGGTGGMRGGGRMSQGTDGNGNRTFGNRPDQGSMPQMPSDGNGPVNGQAGSPDENSGTADSSGESRGRFGKPGNRPSGNSSFDPGQSGEKRQIQSPSDVEGNDSVTGASEKKEDSGISSTGTQTV